MKQRFEIPALGKDEMLVIAVMRDEDVCAIYKLGKAKADEIDGIDIVFQQKTPAKE